MRLMIGNVGHFFVILSFVSSLGTAVAYFFNYKENVKSWLTFARISYLIHSISILFVIIALFVIIKFKYYEYYYAWEHSSNSLPLQYLISCFWEGQEGSFLLWIFWHVVIGWFLIKTLKEWESSVMFVYCLVQMFLCSMLLGVVFMNMKIGSSPFTLLRDAMPDAPIFMQNPGYIPDNGTGLNPLLQSFWMVIHPPTLFLGFALSLVPFSFACSGLMRHEFISWVPQAMPWMVLSMLILGIGILMGAYWAYETLNFGGYWNWDPVENAVYVPWLLGIASIHVMTIYKKNHYTVKIAFILVGLTYLLILYSTFLTRSGILGNASVHSFTDLGLAGQLLVYLLFFFVFFWGLYFSASSKFNPLKKEITIYDKSFWIFLGVLVISLSALHVLFVTSIPVYNKIAEFLGYKLNMAPPSDAMHHYGKVQIWFAIFLLLVSSTAQFFYWKKQDSLNVKKTFYYPIIVSVMVVIVFLISSQILQINYKPSYLILLISICYALVSHFFILKSLGLEKIKFWGGAITHSGIALMVLGILYSSGYSKVISLNTSGLLYSKEFSEEMNRENVLLFRNSLIQMDEYNLKYMGPRVKLVNSAKLINKDHIEILDPIKGIAMAIKPIIYNGKMIYDAGDTVLVNTENTYYEILFQKGNKRFTVFPRAQINPQMGFIASPDIKKFWDKDLYIHVTSIPDPTQPKEWSEPVNYEVAMGDTFFINDYVAILKKLERVYELKTINLKLTSQDAAVKAIIHIVTNDGIITAEPIYLIKDMMQAKIPEYLPEISSKITFSHINTQKNTFTFTVQNGQKDWVILKVYKKPFINFLWLGACVACLGMSISIYRRFKV